MSDVRWGVGYMSTSSAVTGTAATAYVGDYFWVEGRIDEPSWDDAYNLTIDWGDGTTDSVSAWSTYTYTTSGATVSYYTFWKSHTYTAETIDPAPPAPAGTYAVTISDDDTGVASVLSVDVDPDPAPVFSGVSVSPAGPHDEGVTLTVTGTVSDNRTGSVVSIDWGDSSTSSQTPTSGGAFTFTHYYDDDPSGSPDQYAITLTATDDIGQTSTTALTETVNNVAPSVANVNWSVDPSATTNWLAVWESSTPGTAHDGRDFFIKGTLQEPSSDDRGNLTINWGDGSTESLSLTGTTTSGAFRFTASHEYNGLTAPGSPYTITISDDDSGTGNALDVNVIDPAPEFSISWPSTSINDQRR